MKTPDPSIHRQREQQIIQHVEKLLADERLRVDTTQGRRPVTAYVREVSLSDRAMDLKKLMVELNLPDRELQARMPTGQIMEVALQQTRFLFFPEVVGRIRVVCLSPTRQLLTGEEPKPMTGVEVTKALAALPPPLGNVPMTIVLVSTSGFAIEAREVAQRRPDRTVFLVEPNGAGGWSAAGSAETKSVADLFDPEADEQKRQRVRDLIEESKRDLLTSGIATDKLAAKSQLPVQLVESVVKDYARQTPGLTAKRLEGRMVLFRDASTGSLPAATGGVGSIMSATVGEFGGSMGLIEKVRTLFSGKGETAKKIAFLSERKAALGLQADRAYEELGMLEQQETELKQQFKDATGAMTKRRVTGQMLQLRKDMERRQQSLAVIQQQINVVSTHLHNLELVQQGQTAKLPDTNEITEDAVKAEEMLAQLEADSELAGSLGQTATAGMSEEEKALYAELERENAPAEPDQEPPAEVAPKTAVKQPETPAKAAPVVQPRQTESSSPAPAPAPARRTEPEAG